MVYHPWSHPLIQGEVQPRDLMVYLSHQIGYEHIQQIKSEEDLEEVVVVRVEGPIFKPHLAFWGCLVVVIIRQLVSNRANKQSRNFHHQPLTNQMVSIKIR